MNEKKNDRQRQGDTGRDRDTQKSPGQQQRKDMPDRTRTGQVGGDRELPEDRERQGQRDVDKGQPHRKPGRERDQGIE